MATQQRRLPRPQTTFVGRQSDLEAIHDLLSQSQSRSVTLLGPGGVGKTRLALRIADEQAGRFVHGWEFADLSAVEDAALVPEVVARALGLELEREGLVEQLTDHLASRNLLLVLDNFEQVIEAAPFVAGLLDACPDLAVLITSRRVLNIRAATNYFVEPLLVPEPNVAATPERAIANDAVQLFIDRARAADARFQLTGENVPHVVAICRRLEGVPLAIELAASRIRVLSVEMIAQRLDQALLLLSGGPRDAPERQQSLRALVEWSYQLLSIDEQTLLQRVSLFQGGFPIERLKQLESEIASLSGEVPASIDALDRLQALVDASLVHRTDSADGERFRMLETIRSFAAAQLDASPAPEIAREAHARVVLAVAEEGKAGLLGPDPARWSDLLEQEIENIRAALRWAVAAPDPGPELALKFCNAIWLFWKRSLRLAEGREWLERSLRAAGNTESIDVGNVQILLGHSIFDDPVASSAAYERGLAIYRTFGDRRRIAGATISLASTIASMGNDEEALRLYREGAVIFEELELFPDLAILEFQIGELYARNGESNSAAQHLDRSILLYMRNDDVVGAATARSILGRVSFERGRLQEAQALLLLCKAEFEQQRVEDQLRAILCELGAIEFALGRHAEGLELYKTGLRQLSESILYDTDAIEALYLAVGIMKESSDALTATRLLGALDGVVERTEFTPTRAQNELSGRIASALASDLGRDKFDRQLMEGRTATLMDAIEWVLRWSPSDSNRISSAPTAPLVSELLTRREAEVVCLLGLTDREIAERLFIGIRTVTTHVSHILGKLDVSTRSAAIAIAVRYGWCTAAYVD